MKKKFLTFLLAICFMLPISFFLTACGGDPPPDDPPQKELESLNVVIVNSDLLNRYDENTRTFVYQSNEYIGFSDSDFEVTAIYNDESSEVVYGYQINLHDELTDGYAPASETPYTFVIKFEGKKVIFNVKVNGTMIAKPTSLTDQIFTYNTDGNSQVVIPDWMDWSTMLISGNDQTDAGTYDVVVSLLDGYIWDDGTSDPITFEWTIEKASIEKPTSINNSVYWGEPQQAEAHMVNGFVYDVMQVSSESYTNAGTYDATISIINDNYKWSDGTEDSITLQWTIDKVQRPRPTIWDDEHTYYPTNHSEFKIEILNYMYNCYDYDLEYYTISGEIEASDANYDGEYYTFTIALKDTVNYQWETVGDDVMTFNWRINPYVLLSSQEPYFDVNNDIHIYDTTEQSITYYTYDEDEIYYRQREDSVVSATDAGVYLGKFDLVDRRNLRWHDNTNDTKSYMWQIHKREVEAPSLGNEVFTFDNTVKSVFTISSFYEKYITVTGHQATRAGEYTATYEFIPAVRKNCVWDAEGKDYDQTTVALTQDWSIAKRIITPLVADNNTNTYNGQEHTFSFKSYVSLEPYVIITGNKQTDAIKNKEVFVALVFPEDTVWSDETTDSKVYYWTIEPKSVEKPHLKAIDGGCLYYNKLEQSVEIEGELPDYMRMVEGTNKATDAGVYAVQVELLSNNYVWKWNEEDRIVNLGWEILKQSITKPTDNNCTYRFVSKSEQQTFVPTDFDSSTMTISGNKQAEAGTYELTIEIKDKVNYQWANTISTENQNPVVLEWSIGRLQLVKPTLNEHGGTYDGTAKTPTFNNFDDQLMSATKDTSKINAGSYIAEITLLDTRNYEWTDASDGVISVVWEINKDAVYFNFVNFENDWIGTFNTYYDGTAKTISLDLTDIKNADQAEVVYKHAKNGNETTDLTQVGSYSTTIEITLKDSDNYILLYPGNKTSYDWVCKYWSIYDTNIDVTTLSLKFYNGNVDNIATKHNNGENPLFISLLPDLTGQVSITVINDLPHLTFKYLCYKANEEGGWESLTGEDVPSVYRPIITMTGEYRILITAVASEDAPVDLNITGTLDVYFDVV